MKVLLTYQQGDINFQDIDGRFTYIKRQKAEMPVFQSYHDYHKIPVRPDIVLIRRFYFARQNYFHRFFRQQKSGFKRSC